MADFSKIFLLISFLTLLLCCQNKSKETKDLSFKNYIKKLPQINLPYKFKCDSSFIGSGWPKIDYNDTLVKIHCPKNGGIVGKVYENDQSVGILYTFPADVLLPVIFISDSEGHSLGMIELYKLGNCMFGQGGLYDYSSIIQGKITKDLQVLSSIEIISCNKTGCDTVRNVMAKRIDPSGKVQTETPAK